MALLMQCRSKISDTVEESLNAPKKIFNNMVVVHGSAFAGFMWPDAPVSGILNLRVPEQDGEFTPSTLLRNASLQNARFETRQRWGVANVTRPLICFY